MKKILALLLAAVMCFSLVACGGEETPNTEDSSAQEQQAQNDNNEPEVKEPDVFELESTEPEITEPENTEPQYETVEITLDNWQDYFEVRPIYHILENGFSEFEEIVVYCSFINKEGIGIDVYNSDVTIECTYSFCSAPYTVDFESRQVTFGENGTVVGVYQKTKTAEIMNFDDEYWLVINLSTNYGASLDGEIGLVDEFEITRIQGTIMVSY